jgi:phosphatidylserine/phosphatidylglycerophosphate/cardiolipin synthase-like enzyme
MVTPISTNVSLVFANLITLERLEAERGRKDLLVYVVSPWISDVVFPISEFGVYNPPVGAASLTSEIIGEMSSLGADVRICALDYFSDIVPYKDPLQQSNPAARCDQAWRNLKEIGILQEFQARGARIFLNKTFHSKFIATSGALYDGSFNFTLTGYYRNRENGSLIANYGSDSIAYKTKLADVASNFFKTQDQATDQSLKGLITRHDEILKRTWIDWDNLQKRYSEREKRRTDRRLEERGLIYASRGSGEGSAVP